MVNIIYNNEEIFVAIKCNTLFLLVNTVVSSSVNHIKINTTITIKMAVPQNMVHKIELGLIINRFLKLVIILIIRICLNCSVFSAKSKFFFLKFKKNALMCKKIYVIKNKHTPFLIKDYAGNKKMTRYQKSI